MNKLTVPSIKNDKKYYKLTLRGTFPYHDTTLWNKNKKISEIVQQRLRLMLNTGKWELITRDLF